MASLQQEARYNSSGTFTLDLCLSRQKLKQYRLPSPWVYLNKLVQATVIRGGDFVELSTARFPCSETYLSLPPLSSQELAKLLDGHPNLEPGIFQLSLAVEGALRLGTFTMSWIEVHSSGPDDRGVAIRMSQEKANLYEKTWSRPRPGLTVTTGLRWYAAIPCAFWEGWHTSGQYKQCSLPVVLNGQLLNSHPRHQGMGHPQPPQSFHLKLKEASQKEVYIIAPKAHPSLLPGPAPPAELGPGPILWWFSQDWGQHQPLRNAEQVPSSSRFDWLALNDRPALACRGYFWESPGLQQIQWIHHGCLLETIHYGPSQLAPGWSGVVSTQGLRTDLSDCKLIQDEAYLERVRWLGTLLTQSRSSRGE